MHTIAVDTPFKNGARWGFNGNVNSPSFTPSVNVSATDEDTGEVVHRCHYFIKLGADCGSQYLADKPYIQFLGDCTHSLKGQTVPLPELPLGYSGVVEF